MLSEKDRNEVCLKDVKEMMLDFGFIKEEENHKNFALYQLIKEFYPEIPDQAQLIPAAKLDGVKGSTTLPRDLWDKSPEKKKSQRGRTIQKRRKI